MVSPDIIEVPLISSVIVVVLPLGVDNKVLLLVPPGVGDNVPLLADPSSNGVGINDEPTILGVGTLLFIPPSPVIDVGIDDDPIIEEVGEEDDEPSVELFDAGKFIVVGEYVGDVFSFIVGDRELEESP